MHNKARALIKSAAVHSYIRNLTKVAKCNRKSGMLKKLSARISCIKKAKRCKCASVKLAQCLLKDRPHETRYY